MKLYPLTAIVGQEDLLLALTVCAVNPLVGGVLIRGDKGSAKSTAARALAQVMPPIERRPGCRFNCRLDKPTEICPMCNGSDSAVKAEPTPVPFINLPLGVSEERLLGTLDLDKILKESKKDFQPGLLAACHRGILYIDEVNLLPDHIVDLLLDTVAMGVNIVEREGFSISHPARVSLIGTMNPEEGDLRPQLLDRFGLMVDVKAPSDPKLRAEIVSRRSKFESDPEGFSRLYLASQEVQRERIKKAGELLAGVQLSESMLLFASTICSDMGLASLRGDIVLGQTARTLAALEGRLHVSLEDLKLAARLALPHRQRTRPGEKPGINQDRLDQLFQNATSDLEEGKEGEEQEERKQNLPPGGSHTMPGHGAATEAEQDPCLNQENEGEQCEKKNFAIGINPGQITLNIKENHRPETTSPNQAGKYEAGNNKSSLGVSRTAVLNPQPTNLAAHATIKHALVRTGGKITIDRQDLHQKEKVQKRKNLILFVVDCSGSMAARKRMEVVKGTVKDLLDGAYQEREEVSVITFNESRARLALQPTRSIDQAHRELACMETGGTTPLPHALKLVDDFISGNEQRDPLMVLISDGRTNVSLEGGDSFQESLALAEILGNRGLTSLVIDVESGFVKLAKARELAEKLQATYLCLENLTSENLTLNVRKQLKSRQKFQ